jgi:hypothetical protein
MLLDYFMKETEYGQHSIEQDFNVFDNNQVNIIIIIGILVEWVYKH